MKGTDAGNVESVSGETLTHHDGRQTRQRVRQRKPLDLSGKPANASDTSANGKAAHHLTPQSAARWREANGVRRQTQTSRPQQTSVEHNPTRRRNET